MNAHCPVRLMGVPFHVVLELDGDMDGWGGGGGKDGRMRGRVG